MALTAGTRLGPYEILARLGAGGMGEVYRARDSRMGREVAIKVSHENFTDRFSREVHAIAALNHPNVCSLFDVGPNYLVMELVEGQTLEGPLPLPIALDYAGQIAAALEAAHEKGIVHRDLKPGNIIVKPDGTVKVLDFGLAKMGGTPTIPSDNSPTVTMNETQAGVILGTASYMAPEQAKGKPVDRRADIWAFGVVVYEMVTGKRLFRGETTTEILASVLKEDPKWEKVPPELQRLLRMCLEKDPQKRLKHIGDVMALVDEAPGAASIEAAPPSRWFGRAGWIVASLVAGAAGLGYYLKLHQTPPAAATARFEIRMPEKSAANFLKISPDGRMLVLTDSRTRQLLIRPLDALDFRPLPGTEGARYPFWSADSTMIAFFANGKLQKIPVNGGQPQILCDAPDGRGGTWNRDGVILFSPDPANPLERVNATGGDPVSVTKLTVDGEDHRFPEFLPDQRHFLFTANRADQSNIGIFVGSLDGGPPAQILPDVSNAAYVPPPENAAGTGHILFRRGTALMAAPFDAANLKLAGDVFPVAQNVGISANFAYAAFSVSSNGVLAHSIGTISSRDMVWADRKGNRLGNVGKSRSISYMALSPDEKTVAYVSAEGSGRADLWLYDIAHDSATKFTFGPGTVVTPLWSPDGGRIAYGASESTSGGGEIRQKLVAGGKEDLVQHSGGLVSQLHLFDWSPDGKSLLFTPAVTLNKSKSDLFLLPMEGDHKATVYLQTLATEYEGQYSPDGHWVAYVSDETGKLQVNVQPIPATGAKWQISAAGGTQPAWRRDGKEMFYISPEHKLMAVPVKTGTTFEAGAPQELFPANLTDLSYALSYAPSRDGQRFLLVVPAEETAAPPITIVLNWQAEFKK